MNNKVEGPETFGQPNLPVAMAPAFFCVQRWNDLAAELQNSRGGWSIIQRVTSAETGLLCI